MNEFLATRWTESVRRLALGIQPTDPVLGARIGHPVAIALDGTPWPLPPHLRDPSASPWEEPYFDRTRTAEAFGDEPVAVAEGLRATLAWLCEHGEL